MSATPPPTNPDLLVVGDLVVDLVAPRARRGERRLHLSPREHIVLCTLAAHAGHPVTREELLALIPEHSDNPATNVIDMTIHHLRFKVDRAHRKHLIQTIRGEGYALVDAEEPGDR